MSATRHSCPKAGAGPTELDDQDHRPTIAQREDRPTKPQPTLGRRLKALRLSRNLSLKDLSASTGLSSSFLSMVETGQNEMTVGRLVALADFYEVGLTDLIPERALGQPVVLRRDDRQAIDSPDRPGQDRTARLLDPRRHDHRDPALRGRRRPHRRGAQERSQVRPRARRRTRGSSSPRTAQSSSGRAIRSGSRAVAGIATSTSATARPTSSPSGARPARNTPEGSLLRIEFNLLCAFGPLSVQYQGLNSPYCLGTCMPASRVGSLC